MVTWFNRQFYELNVVCTIIQNVKYYQSFYYLKNLQCVPMLFAELTDSADKLYYAVSVFFYNNLHLKYLTKINYYKHCFIKEASLFKKIKKTYI